MLLYRFEGGFLGEHLGVAETPIDAQNPGSIVDLSVLDPERFGSLTSWLKLTDPVAAVREAMELASPIDPGELRIRAPLDRQEVWAAGVTYLRSKEARMEESEGGGSFYDRVYAAERPELFLKATPSRVVGPGGSVRIRQDAQWNVPEPEIALVVSPSLRIVGYTIGNDMSSRDIEGENPLYLPQAKVYAQACALGPGILLEEEPRGHRNFAVQLRIEREGEPVFQGETETARMKRRFDELVEYLGRDNLFPDGAFLLTGTGVVPPDDFTLQPGDVVSITVPEIGTLRNTVVRGALGVTTLPAPPAYFVEKLRALHLSLRDRLREQLQRSATSELSAVTAARGGDTIYGIDERGEEVLLEYCREWAREMPFRLVAEGLPKGEITFPEGSGAAPLFRLIVDPIDGTRCIMYDKRSAWILSGVAPEVDGVTPTLADVVVAMQTEVPTTRQYLGDLLYARRGEGVQAERHNLLTGDWQPFVPRPSAAPSLAHGFATISKFFLGAKALTARVEETLFEQILGPPADGNPLVFDDQYLSSGGQLYELMVGHDRFNADLRPIMHAAVQHGATEDLGGVDAAWERGRPARMSAIPDAGGTPALPGGPRRLCAHPYDLCGELIAREAGVIVTDESGRPLSSPLDVDADLCWIGYANETLRAQIEPLLLPMLAALRAGA